MRESLFTHDKAFFRDLFSMLLVVALQNVIAYSVNMADNNMLGAYLSIIKFTFLLFMVTQVLLAALRSVQTVKIAFINSCVSLVLNIVINSTFIYGRFGFPELGVAGAAIGTITSRSVELLIVLFYLWKMDTKLRLFREPGIGSIPPGAEGGLSEKCPPDPGGRTDLVDLHPPADSDPRASFLRCHRCQFGGYDLLSVYEGDCCGDVVLLCRTDGQIHRCRKPCPRALGRADTLCHRPLYRDPAWRDPLLHKEAAAFTLCPAFFRRRSRKPADRDHEYCDDDDVLSDAGRRRRAQGKRRLQVHHVHQPDQHMADRDPAFLCGCLLVEMADPCRGGLPAVRPGLQMPARVSPV